jgi:cytosine/adenosine deaminase-related metal-dependent hydrolase
MIYSSTKIITLHNGVIADGAVRVRGKRITDVGRRPVILKKYPRDPEIHLAETALMPGLVNAHAHLEDGGLRGAIDRSSSFSLWLETLRDRKAAVPPEEFLNAVHLGVLESLKCGTTTVLDVSETGASFKLLFNERLRSIVFLEFFSAGSRADDDIFRDALSRASGFMANDLSNWGICPYSPFFVQRPLFRQCLRYASEQNVFVMSHVGESAEENEYYIKNNGNLTAYLARAGLARAAQKSSGPVGYCIQQGCIAPRMILVHGNFMSDEEMAFLARENVSVAVCPRSFLQFRHGPFPVPRLLEHGVNVCLGTETLAASESLDLFEEMYCLKKMVPALSGEEVLRIAVRGGVRAMGLQGVLGQIRPGFLADIIGMECCSGPDADLFEELVMEEREIKFVMVNGQEIIR